MFVRVVFVVLALFVSSTAFAQDQLAGVLIVPHLMSFGGIEQGVRKRLEGLEYAMTEQALMPDDRIVQWVMASAR